MVAIDGDGKEDRQPPQGPPAALVPAQPPNIPAQAPAAAPLPVTSAAAPPPTRIIPSTEMYMYLVATGQFRRDMAAFQANANLKTGFLSVVTSKGTSGYKDFATDESGNAVDCLVNYFGYPFQDAVAALAVFDGMAEEDLDIPAGNLGIPEEVVTLHGLREAAGTAPKPQGISVPPATQQSPQEPPPAPKPFIPPAPFQGSYRQLFAYLVQQRAIPAELVQRLIDDGLLYQEAAHNNAVFIDLARTYAELRGTLSGKQFHGMAPGSATTGFWSFKPLGPHSVPTGAFICEAAIDAISLHLLRQRFPLPTGDNPMYCSIGGVANQQRIDRIKAIMDAMGLPTTLAVDNDEAGEKCRQRNPGCFAYVPRLKDWNADWLDSKRQSTSGTTM